jgi:hypothetical protein
MACDNVLLQSADNGVTWTHCYTFPYAITKLKVFQSNLMVGQGYAAAYCYTADFVTFTVSTQTGGSSSAYSRLTAAVDNDDTAFTVASGAVFTDENYAMIGTEVVKITNIADNILTVTRGQVGTTATEHAADEVLRELGAVAGIALFGNIGDQLLIGADTANTIRVTDNPFNSGFPWSEQYVMPNSGFAITELLDDDLIWYVRKQDSLYYVAEDATYEVIPGLSSEANTTDNHKAYRWHGKVYIISGINSVYEYDPSSGATRILSPARFTMGTSTVIVSYAGTGNYNGTPTAIWGDETFLYLAVTDGTSVHILAGRDYNINGTDWAWHPIYTLEDESDVVDGLIMSLSGAKRMTVLCNDVVRTVYSFIVPVSYADVLSETGYAVLAAGDIITPWLVNGFPGMEAYWDEVDVTSICITAKTSITVYYQKKGDSTWTSLGACTTSALSGANYPTEVTDTFTLGFVSERVRFKFSLATTDTDYSPILYLAGTGIVVRSKLLVGAKRKKLVQFTLLVADEWREQNGSVEVRDQAVDIAALRALFTSEEVITIIGPDAAVYVCLPYKDFYHEHIALDEFGLNNTYQVTVYLQEA